MYASPFFRGAILDAQMPVSLSWPLAQPQSETRQSDRKEIECHKYSSSVTRRGRYQHDEIMSVCHIPSTSYFEVWERSLLHVDYSCRGHGWIDLIELGFVIDPQGMKTAYTAFG